MTFHITRRKFLNTTAAGVGAAGLASAMPWSNEARAATNLTGVMWGGSYIKAAKLVLSKQDKFNIRWELHSGGSARIIPKIKAAWPNVPYDFVAQFQPLYYVWLDEGWPEPFTYEEMPNLRDIPEEWFVRNDQGQIIQVPTNLNAVFFGYRKDIVPFVPKTMEDLLDPRLKGQLGLRNATSGLNNNGVMYSLAMGGDEHNMEPGWDFLKKLAKSGNIARIYEGDIGFINTMTSGESSVGFGNMAGWSAVAKNFPVEFLIRDKATAPGFQVGYLQEGLLVPKASANIKATKEFLNWFISAEMNELYNNVLKNLPSNSKSKPSDFAKHISFDTKEDRAKYTHNYDWKYMASQKNAMINKFEQEITPILK